jgi:hypothetical protein
VEGQALSYYAQISDFNGRYNTDNAALMADPGQTGNAAEIAARQQLCLNIADDWVNGFLLKSLYSSVVLNPQTAGIVDRNGNIPSLLTMAAVMFTGWLTSTSSGVRDYDKDNKPMNRYTADYQTAKEIMLMIQSGENFLLNVEV